MKKKYNIVNKIKKRITGNRILRRYFFLTLALIISAISYNIFLKPAHIVTGGSSGIAIVLEYIFEFNSSVTIFILDFVFLVLCFIFLGKKEAIGVLYITFLYPILVFVFSDLSNAILITNNNILLISIYAGVLSGISSGLIFKVGVNTGGLGVLSKIIYKYKKVSLSKVNFILSLLVVFMGVYAFGVNMLLYSIIVILITRLISENILLGVSRNKTMFIVSEKYDEIESFLSDTLFHDVTIMNIIGRYSSINAKMIMSIIPNTEYYIVKEAIIDIDKSAFVFASDSYEVARQDKKLALKNQL